MAAFLALLERRLADSLRDFRLLDFLDLADLLRLRKLRAERYRERGVLISSDLYSWQSRFTFSWLSLMKLTPLNARHRLISRSHLVSTKAELNGWR